jgi:RNA polymerase sigma factor (sigma-70 family)
MAKSNFGEILRFIFRMHHVQQAGDTGDGELLRRFAQTGEDGAFTVLFEQHGPMVLGVCKRILGDYHLAEDAFQATFHVLARRAASIRIKKSLGPWLYTVAQRLALRAKAKLMKERDQERRAGLMPRSQPLDDATWRELAQVLDEEMGQLPEKYRAPLVLCYFENKGRDLVARELGWAEGTVARRLSRGRELLRSRLVKRGITLSTAALATALTEKIAIARVPALLAMSTIKAATATVIGGKAAAGLSAQVLLLAEETMQSMFLAKAKMVLVALTLSFAVSGVGWAGYKEFLGAPQTEIKAQVKAAPQREKEKKPAVDLYGDPLPEGAVVRLGTSRYRSGSALTTSAVSPNGKLLAGAGKLGIQIWDAEDGKPLNQIPELREGVGGLVFTADNKMLIASQHSNVPNYRTQFPSKLHFVDIAAAKIVKELDLKIKEQDDTSNDPLYYSCLLVLPDGKSILLNSGGPILRLVDTANGEEIRAFRSAGKNVHAVALAPDGRKVAAVGDDGTVLLWEIASGKELVINQPTATTKESAPVGKKAVPNQKKSVRSPKMANATFSSDSKTLATEWMSEGIFLWESSTGILKRSLIAQEQKSLGNLTSLSFSPNGSTLLAAFEQTFVFWDVGNGKEIRRLERRANTLADDIVDVTSFLPEGQTLIQSSTLRAKTIFGLPPVGFNLLSFTFVDAITGESRRLLPGNLGSTNGLTFLNEGRWIATREESRSGATKVWDTSTGKLVFERTKTPSPGEQLVALSPMGILAKANTDEITFWNFEISKQLRAIEAKDQLPVAMSIGMDGRKLATFDRNRTVHLWDLANGNEIRHFAIDDPKAAFSPDLNLCASGAQGMTIIKIWSLATGKELLRFKRGGGGAIGFFFTSDGRTLLETAGGKDAFLWEVASGDQRRAIPRPQLGVPAGISPDNRLLAFGRGQIHIYDTATNSYIATFKGHEGEVRALSFSPDGRLLASGSEDMTGLLWNVAGLAKPFPSAPLSDDQRAACWSDLAGSAPDAYAAIWKLIGDKNTVNLLKEKLQPAGPLEVAKKDQTRIGKEQLRAIRANEVLEAINTPEARQILERQALGRADAWQTEDAKATLERLKSRTTATK